MSDLPQDESTPDSISNLCHHVCNVTLKVGNGEVFLKDVGSISATGKCTHCGQVARVTTLRLDDKHSRLSSWRRLLDTAADLNTCRHQSRFVVINLLQLHNIINHFILSHSDQIWLWSWLCTSCISNAPSISSPVEDEERKAKPLTGSVRLPSVLCLSADRKGTRSVKTHETYLQKICFQNKCGKKVSRKHLTQSYIAHWTAQHHPIWLQISDV